MFYVLLLILAAVGAGIYFLVFMQNVPGAAADERDLLGREGVPEPLVPDVQETEDAAVVARQ